MNLLSSTYSEAVLKIDVDTFLPASTRGGRPEARRHQTGFPIIGARIELATLAQLFGIGVTPEKEAALFH